VITKKQVYLELKRESWNIRRTVTGRGEPECVVVLSEVRRKPQYLLVGEKELEGKSKFTKIGE
jgi:hypothetical protein